jgi:hypothetical protein
MTTLREAAQQALEALGKTQRHRAYTQGIPDAITALRDALAQEEQEDIAQNLQSRHDAAKLLEERRQEIAQPRREWQGLTTQEAMALTDTAPKGVFYGCDAGIGLGIWIAAVAAAERALKEKNNG